MAMANQFKGHVTAPNPHYSCAACRSDLWDFYKRFRNPIACPNINIADDGRTLCDRCYYKEG